MPDIYFDVDVALSEVPVNKMPLIDSTDMLTIEDAVAYNAAGMALYWHFVTSAGAYTLTAVTPTTAGTYDWTDQGAAGIYTIEIPATGGASINNDTEGYGWFSGVATGIMPWVSPTYGFRAAAINDSLCDTNTTGLLAPTTAGRTLDVASTGEAGLDLTNVLLSNAANWAGITASGTLSGTHSSTTADLGTNAPSVDVAGQIINIPTRGLVAIVDSYNTSTGVATFSPSTAATLTNGDQYYLLAAPKPSTGSPPAVNATQLAGQTITAAAGVTFPTSVASPTNITAGTITTVTNLTNAPTAGDLTATMKTSVGTAVAASAVASVTGNVGGSVGSVTGNVGGNVTGSVGSVATGGITSGSIAADAIGASELAADAVTEIAAGVWASVARTLTTLDEDSTTLDLDATIRAAMGLATANMDTQLGALTGLPTLTQLNTSRYLKNTASQKVYFTLVDSTDHVTRKTGITVTAQRSLDGAAFGSATGAVTEVGNGVYYLTTTTADINADDVVFRFTGTACDPVELHVVTAS